MSTHSVTAWGREVREVEESVDYLRSTCERTRLGTHTNPTAGDILRWLEAHGVEVLIQDIGHGQRAKNRCVVQFRAADGSLRAVGGTTIAGAVCRAQIRQAARGVKGETS